MNQKMFMVYGMPKKEGNTKRWDLGYSKAQNPKQKKAKKKKKTPSHHSGRDRVL